MVVEEEAEQLHEVVDLGSEVALRLENFDWKRQ